MSTTKPTIGCFPPVAAILLVLIATFSLCTRCWLHTDPTDEADWQSAAETAVELAEPTDTIRVEPTWSEAPLPHLTEIGNLLNPNHQPLLEDLAHVHRLLIISETGRTDDALQRLPFDANAEQTHDFGTVRLLEVPIPEQLRIDDDLTRHLGDVDVYITEGDRQSPCRRSGDTWRCDAGDDTLQIHSELLEIEHEPRRCIRSDPPGGDRALVIEADIHETRDLLRIRAGLDERAARLERGGDVVYRIYIDDAPLTDEDQRLDAHTSRWTAHDVPHTDIDGDAAALRIEIESVDPSPHHRRFCFNAWGLSEEQAQR